MPDAPLALAAVQSVATGPGPSDVRSAARSSTAIVEPDGGDAHAHGSGSNAQAWAHTSLTLESFGFTISKVLDSLVEAGRTGHSNSPRIVGLALGTLAIVMCMAEYMAVGGTFLFFTIWLKAV